jgi:hypothetical protein
MDGTDDASLLSVGFKWVASAGVAEGARTDSDSGGSGSGAAAVGVGVDPHDRTRVSFVGSFAGDVASLRASRALLVRPQWGPQWVGRSVSGGSGAGAGAGGAGAGAEAGASADASAVLFGSLFSENGTAVRCRGSCASAWDLVISSAAHTQPLAVSIACACMWFAAALVFL